MPQRERVVLSLRNPVALSALCSTPSTARRGPELGLPNLKIKGFSFIRSSRKLLEASVEANHS